MASRSFGRPAARFTAISLSVIATRVDDVEIVVARTDPWPAWSYCSSLCSLSQTAGLLLSTPSWISRPVKS